MLALTPLYSDLGSSRILDDRRGLYGKVVSRCSELSPVRSFSERNRALPGSNVGGSFMDEIIRLSKVQNQLDLKSKFNGNLANLDSKKKLASSPHLLL
ncbi:hypothetical protein ACTXT7_017047, partial [Hymenolepis weldensis]